VSKDEQFSKIARYQGSARCQGSASHMIYSTDCPSLVLHEVGLSSQQPLLSEPHINPGEPKVK
jgi:hypothetical protein